jgi:membrane protein DedA with SNARE-associated domain
MDQIIGLIGRYGVVVVFANVLAEQAGVPLPALPTLVVAGTLAADGRLSVAAIVAAALSASLIADTSWYLIGRRFGYKVLRTVCRVSVSPDSCVRQTEEVFQRYGLASLVVAKFVPGYSTIAPTLAGILRTAALPFLASTAAGALLWAGAPLVAGMVFHRTVDRILRALEGLGTWSVAALAGALAVYLLLRWARLLRFRRTLRMARVAVDELRRMIDEGRQPLILDVRTHLAHRHDPRTIPGAIRFRLDELDDKLAGIPRDQEIILFCT